MTVTFDTPTTSRPNPQKRNLLIRRLARAPWWLLVLAVLVLLFVRSVSDRHP